jgi:hypothetical protein
MYGCTYTNRIATSHCVNKGTECMISSILNVHLHFFVDHVRREPPCTVAGVDLSQILLMMFPVDARLPSLRPFSHF